MAIDGALAFRITTQLGFTVRCTTTYWNFIVPHKHPIMAGREAEIRIVLSDPDEIRRSRKDSNSSLLPGRLAKMDVRGSSPGKW
jgi:hypothetical protein